MSYHFTRVPHYSPNGIYELTNDITLKPAKPTEYKGLYGPGSSMVANTLFFITNSKDIEEHIQKLRKWVFFDSCVLWSALYDFFERGFMMEHNQSSSLVEINEALEDGITFTDFENIGNLMYGGSAPSETISYKKLYRRFEAFQDEEMSLIETFLFQVHQPEAIYGQYLIFDHYRSYWKIAINYTILEAIIGHASDCPGSILSCDVCKKKLHPHRRDSEKEWRKEILSNIIKDEKVRDQYLQVINAAYDKVRNRTTHPGQLPAPPLLSYETGIEIYPTARAINEFGTDRTALRGLLLHVNMVTRYLLLYKLFGLNTLPELPPLKRFSMKLGQAVFKIDETKKEPPDPGSSPSPN